MKRCLIACVMLLVGAASMAADEGMWTYNNFPTEKVQKAYGFTPSDAWLEHLRLSSVRFGGPRAVSSAPTGW